MGHERATVTWPLNSAPWSVSDIAGDDGQNREFTRESHAAHRGANDRGYGFLDRTNFGGDPCNLRRREGLRINAPRGAKLS